MLTTDTLHTARQRAADHGGLCRSLAAMMDGELAEAFGGLADRLAAESALAATVSDVEASIALHGIRAARLAGEALRRGVALPLPEALADSLRGASSAIEGESLLLMAWTTIGALLCGPDWARPPMRKVEAGDGVIVYVSDAPESAPTANAPAEPTAKVGKESRALALLVEHPDWTDVRIAKEAGCARTSLARMPLYTAARRVQAAPARPIPKARHDRRTGAKDAEAADE